MMLTNLRRVALATVVLVITSGSATVLAHNAGDNVAAINDSNAADANFQTFFDAHSTDTSPAYYSESVKEANKAAQELRRAADEFSSQGLGQKEARAVERLRASTLDEARAMDDWSKAVAKNDLQAGDKASLERSNSIDDFNAALNDYSKAKYFLTDSQYQFIYWVALAVTALASVVTFLWYVMRNYCCKHKKSAVELRQNAERKKIAWLSLTPLAGAGITLLTFYFTIGNTYVVMWGAIVVGTGVFVNALIGYNKFLKKGSA